MKQTLFLLPFLIFTFYVQAQNVGIGTPTPKTSLDIKGGIRNQPLYLIGTGTAIIIPDNQSNINLTGNFLGQFSATVNIPEDGQKLVIDNNSNQTGALIGGPDIRGGLNEYIFSDGEWKTTKTNAWDLNGNLNTNPGNNFIGTIDNKDVVFKRNNTEKMRMKDIGLDIIGDGNFIGSAKALNMDIYSSSSLNSGVTSSLSFGGSNFTSGRISSIATSTSAARMGFFTGSSFAGGTFNLQERLSIVNNGFIGIGTATPNAPLQLANTTSNRKIVLFEVANNDHQFFGVGTNASMQRYQVNSISSSHGFFAGINSTASTELMRIQGNGNVGIGTASPNAPLQLANTAGNRKIVLFEGANNDHQFYGVGINTSMMRYQVDATTSSHTFFAGNSASTSNELMRINGNGNVNIAGFTKLGESSMPIKTATFLSDLETVSGSLIGSWSQVFFDIPIHIRAIISYYVITTAVVDGLTQSYSPFGTINTDIGKVRYGLQLNGALTRFFANYENCDLCNKPAKLILHVTYTDAPLW